jgi:predicted NBD/HSP70 family sugar kinase
MGRVNSPAVPVLQTILAQGHRELSHRQLADVGGFSERSVSNVLRDLGPRGLMTGGHPAKLGPGLGLCLGISVGRESLRAALIDANGDVHKPVSRSPFRRQLEKSPKVILKRIKRIADDVLAQGLADPALWPSDQPGLNLLGVSVAWPSPLDRAGRPRGSALKDGAWFAPVRDTGQIPTLQERVAAALGPPFTPEHVYAVNDANAHALAVVFRGSRLRAGEQETDQWRVVLVVRVSGGLGAATMLSAPHTERRLSFIDSKLIAGTNGLAGELGHLPVDKQVIVERNRDCPAGLVKFKYERAECSCGEGRHHLEAFASADALMSRLEASGMAVPHGTRGETSLVRSIFSGEVPAIYEHARTDVGRILGRTLANPILMLDPYSITLTGSLASEELRKGVLLERGMWRSAIGDDVRVNFLSGEANVYAGVRGAALAMIRNFVYRQMGDVIGEKARTGLPLNYTAPVLDA